MPRFLFLISIVFFLIFFSSFKASAQDTLYTIYGDVVLGKVTKINSEKVFFKSSYNSVFDIKFSEISRLASSRYFLLNDIHNKNWKGNLFLDSARFDVLMIQTIDSVHFFSPKQIFEITLDKKKKLREKLNFGLDFGYTRAKAEESLSLSFGANSNFKTRRWDNGFAYNVYVAAIGPTLVGREGFDAHLSYILSNDWFFTGKYSLFSSTEQSLDLRKNVSLGLGKYLIHKESKTFTMSGGILANKEKFLDDENSYKSTELFYGAHMSGKILEKINLKCDWVVYPSMTNESRVRNYFNLDIRFVLLSHFDFGIHYVLNTDNRPPLETSTADYIIEAKFGWSFQRH